MAEFIESTLYNGEVAIKFYPESHQYWAAVDGERFKRRTGVTTICGIKDKSIGLMSWQRELTADYLLTLIEAGKEIGIEEVLEAAVQSDIKKDEAANIGTAIHDWVEKFIKFKKGEPGYPEMPPIPEIPEAVTGVNSFMEWTDKHKVEFISSERVVYSKEHDFIGTLDIEAKVDGKLCLVDLKSSNGLYNSVRAQTAAYAMADMEETPKKKYKGRWAIRVSKLTEEEYYAKEERKKEMKKAIARIQGKEYKNYSPRPYEVFEAKDLDNGESFIERDFKAFLAHKDVYRWDAITDPYRNGDNW